MSRIEEARHAAEAASQRRVHLSTRALLAALIRTSACFTRVSFRARAKLDATGGAYDVHATG